MKIDPRNPREKVSTPKTVEIRHKKMAMIPNTRLLFISGPYHGATPWDREVNIYNAKALGVRVIKETNMFPIIPQANTACFDGLAPDARFLAGTLALMLRCDGVLMMPDWKKSKGARAEERMAQHMGILIAYTFEEIHQVFDLKTTKTICPQCGEDLSPF